MTAREHVLWAAEALCYDVEEITRRRRRHEDMPPRRILVLYLRRARFSWPQIGRALERHHSSCIEMHRRATEAERMTAGLLTGQRGVGHSAVAPAAYTV